MRLSQIARKLNVTQSEIVKHFITAGVDSPKGGNAKLSDEQLEVIANKFGNIEFNDQEEIEVDVEPASTIPEIPVEEIEEVEEEPIAESIVEEQKLEESEKEPEEEIEVIRVKKIKLEGIKVLGKIDLPEPVVKKPKEQTEGEENELNDKPEASRNRFSKQNRRTPHKKAPLTFEQKQALELKRQQREKREREQKLKQKKKKHYYTKVAPKIAPKAVKKKSKKVVEKTQRTKITTKNPFKRFWIWLNDPYA